VWYEGRCSRIRKQHNTKHKATWGKAGTAGSLFQGGFPGDIVTDAVPWWWECTASWLTALSQDSHQPQGCKHWYSWWGHGEESSARPGFACEAGVSLWNYRKRGSKHMLLLVLSLHTSTHRSSLIMIRQIRKPHCWKSIGVRLSYWASQSIGPLRPIQCSRKV
jgi:hypothetical protein